MNTSLQLNSQFQKIIREKTENYVDRPLISTIINNFLQNHNHGYFTLIGSPGSGKSAILANYTIQSPQTVYYSAEVEGKNRAEEFLITLYTQLTQKIDNQNPALPDNVTEGSWYLSLLLQKISDNLTAEEKLNRKRENTLCQKCQGSGYKGRVGAYELLLLDRKIQTAISNGLTDREMNLLIALAKSPGQPLNREKLAGIDEPGRSVDVGINRLRRKIEKDPRMPLWLQTVRGEGYILRPDK